MSAIEPAGEKIVRNLQQALARRHDDLTRVELWAGALDGFTKAIPDYGHGQTPPASDETSVKRRGGEMPSSPHPDISDC